MTECAENKVYGADALATFYPYLEDYWHHKHVQNRTAPHLHPKFYAQRLREVFLRIPFEINRSSLQDMKSTVKLSSAELEKIFLKCQIPTHQHAIYVLRMQCTRVETVGLVEDLTVGITMESQEESLDTTSGKSELKQWWGHAASQHVHLFASELNPSKKIKSFPLIVSGRSLDLMDKPVLLHSPFPLTGVQTFEVMRQCLPGARHRSHPQDPNQILLPVNNPAFVSLLHDRLHREILQEQADPQVMLPKNYYDAALKKIKKEYDPIHSLWRGPTSFHCHLLGEEKAWSTILDTLSSVNSFTGRSTRISITLTLQIHAMIIGYDHSHQPSST